MEKIPKKIQKINVTPLIKLEALEKIPKLLKLGARFIPRYRVVQFYHFSKYGLLYPWPKNVDQGKEIPKHVGIRNCTWTLIGLVHT